MKIFGRVGNHMQSLAYKRSQAQPSGLRAKFCRACYKNLASKPPTTCPKIAAFAGIRSKSTAQHFMARFLSSSELTYQDLRCTPRTRLRISGCMARNQIPMSSGCCETPTLTIAMRVA